MGSNIFQQLRPRSCCLLNLVSPLIHVRSEKFDAVDAARTGDLMVVAELWEDGLDLVSTAHLSWWQGLESLYCLSAGRILMDLPIGGDHGVVGGIGKLNPGTKAGFLAPLLLNPVPPTFV